MRLQQAMLATGDHRQHSTWPVAVQLKVVMEAVNSLAIELAEKGASRGKGGLIERNEASELAQGVSNGTGGRVQPIA